MRYLQAVGLVLLSFLTTFITANAQVGVFIRPSTGSISSPVSGQSWVLNSTNLTLVVWNGSSWQVVSTPLNNFTAVVAPTSSNDNTQGYSSASIWYNTISGNLYVCTSAATSAAVWVQINNLGALTIPLANLDTTGATTGQAIVYNGSVFAAGSPIALNQLSTSGATTGQSIIYNGTNYAPGSPSINLSQLTQSSASAGDFASYNGTVWVHKTILPGANGGTGTALFSSGVSTFASAGSVVIADTSITSSSIIVVTQQNTSPVSEYFSVSLSAGTGFTIHSTNSSSTAVVNWIRIK